mmetsp:Transcript_72100/g.222680  ORF Transcript_72100/g.222680 Transcript_72100/m.222680 type:complete len:203 (-) Transcript_72100:962-1570(-)
MHARTHPHTHTRPPRSPGRAAPADCSSSQPPGVEQEAAATAAEENKHQRSAARRQGHEAGVAVLAQAHLEVQHLGLGQEFSRDDFPVRGVLDLLAGRKGLRHLQRRPRVRELTGRRLAVATAVSLSARQRWALRHSECGPGVRELHGQVLATLRSHQLRERAVKAEVILCAGIDLHGPVALGHRPGGLGSRKPLCETSNLHG